jgi:glycosyltransferase involved in cell wall biosynthesis
MARTVVHFTDTKGYGGAEKMLVTTLAGFDQERWRTILMHYPNAAAMRVAEEAKGHGIETRVVPDGDGRPGVRALARSIRSEAPEIFHAHLVWPLRCTRGIVAARFARVPYVIATQQLYSRPVGLKDRIRQWLVSTLVDRYLAVSEAMATELRGFVAGGGRVAALQNAIDVDRFRHAEQDLRSGLIGDLDRVVVLTLARLDFQKGLEYLIEAIPRVPGALFVIAGDGPDRSRLEAKARECGIGNRVVFLGHRDDIPELLAACDIYVLPSLFEGLPVSVLEAMAAGKPVIATDIGGTNEAVVPGVTGMLVAAADAGALAREIDRLVHDPERRAAMGRAGQERVSDLFTVERMARRIMEAYEALAGGGDDYS